MMKKILESSTLVFLALFPIFSLTFFHSQLITLLEIVMVSIILVTTIIVHKDSRKNLKYLFLYYLLVLLYLFVSYRHSFSFNSLVPGNFHYSIFKETLTILKLVTPINLLYSLKYQNISYKKYITLIKFWALFISLSIIISNVFKFSLSTYSDNVITKNIFEWNINNYYQETASRFYFMYANQIALWLLILEIILLYDFLTRKKDYLSITCIFLSMLMLGTRISSLGSILALVVLLAIYFLFVILKKCKFQKSIFFLGVLFIVWLILIPISPYKNRDLELNQSNLSTYQDIDTLTQKKAYVYDNYNPSYLPKVFFESYYPISYDEDFWYQFVKSIPTSEMNYRLIETSIIKRVVEINNNKYDILWGISNTRIQNIFNIERDFVLHYYAFGIIGSIILLFIFIYLLCYMTYMFFKYQTFFLFTLSLVLCLFIMSAYLTGNILNSLNIMLPFTFIISGNFTKKNI